MLLLGLQPRPFAKSEFVADYMTPIEGGIWLNDSFSAMKLCFFSDILLERWAYLPHQQINKRTASISYLFLHDKLPFSMIKIHICKHVIYTSTIYTYMILRRVRILEIGFYRWTRRKISICRWQKEKESRKMKSFDDIWRLKIDGGYREVGISIPYISKGVATLVHWIHNNQPPRIQYTEINLEETFFSLMKEMCRCICNMFTIPTLWLKNTWLIYQGTCTITFLRI